MLGFLFSCRAEAKKAKTDLSEAQENHRRNEQLEKLKMDHEYSSNMTRLATELDRVRMELDRRTEQMQRELQKWKLQAEVRHILHMIYIRMKMY